MEKYGVIDATCVKVAETEICPTCGKRIFYNEGRLMCLDCGFQK